jgi:hypothetical protein
MIRNYTLEFILKILFIPLRRNSIQQEFNKEIPAFAFTIFHTSGMIHPRKYLRVQSLCWL